MFFSLSWYFSGGPTVSTYTFNVKNRNNLNYEYFIAWRKTPSHCSTPFCQNRKQRRTPTNFHSLESAVPPILHHSQKKQEGNQVLNYSQQTSFKFTPLSSTAWISPIAVSCDKAFKLYLLLQHENLTMQTNLRNTQNNTVSDVHTNEFFWCIFSEPFFLLHFYHNSRPRRAVCERANHRSWFSGTTNFFVSYPVSCVSYLPNIPVEITCGDKMSMIHPIWCFDASNFTNSSSLFCSVRVLESDKEETTK